MLRFCGKHGQLAPRGQGCPECSYQKPRTRARVIRSSSSWHRQRARILKVAGRRCQHLLEGGARCPEWATEVDHIQPLADGGADRLSNLQALCHRHHAEKTTVENTERSRAKREAVLKRHHELRGSQ